MPILLNYPLFHADDDNGAPLTGGLLYTYEAGTSTAKATYTTSAMTVANSNPVILNSRGEAIIYGFGLYKLVLKTSALVTVWTEPNLEFWHSQRGYVGATEPSDAVAGMLWFDTTNHVMKVRNFDDSAWLTLPYWNVGTEPSDPMAGMLWFDTANYTMKFRNAGDDAWIGLMHGDVSQKIWVYRNAAMDGWVVDSSVTDKVLGLKGGSTYTTGAASAGSWTLSGLSHSHTHTLADGGLLNNVANYAQIGKGTGLLYSLVTGGGSTQHASATTDTGSTTTVSSDGTWRAAAAVGTLQYLDLT